MTTIAYRAELATVFGCTNMALFASQALYWMKNKASQARDGWFYKTRDDWQAETGLSRYRQESARKKLRELGVLEEDECRKQWRTVKWYRINKARLYALVNEQLDTLPAWAIKELYDSASSKEGEGSAADNTETGTDRAASGFVYNLSPDSLYPSLSIDIYQYIKSIKNIRTIVPNLRIEEVITHSDKKVSETQKSVIYPSIPENGTIVSYMYRDIEIDRESEQRVESGQDAVQPQAGADSTPGQPHALTTHSRRTGTDVANRKAVFDPQAFKHCHPLLYAFASRWLRHSALNGAGTLNHFAAHGFTDHLSRLYLDAFEKERGVEIRRQCEQTLGWYPPLTDADLLEAGDALRAMA